MPTGNLCELTACYPNPCSNKGQCGLNINSAGGYQCVCPNAYTGRNCTVDVDECIVNGKLLKTHYNVVMCGSKFLKNKSQGNWMVNISWSFHM